jgi:hypothetical protein
VNGLRLATLLLAPLPFVFASQALKGQALPGEDVKTCAIEGDFRLLCSQNQWEDLQPVPDSEWVVASSINGGGLHLIHTKDKLDLAIYPAASARKRPDETTYGVCRHPPDNTPGSPLSMTGAAVARGKAADVYLVYSVGLNAYKPNMGPDRVGVQIFELDLRARAPVATWIGCVLPPDGVALNSVAPLANGAFLATHFNGGVGVTREKVASGNHIGEVWEWRPGAGWSRIQGSDLAGANGIVVSPDGSEIHVSAWGALEYVRLRRDATTVKRDVVKLDFRIDNMHWAPRGDAIIAAGHRDSGPSVVVSIDPKTSRFTTLFEKPETPDFHHFTGAVRVGDDIWIGSSRSKGLGIMPLRP